LVTKHEIERIFSQYYVVDPPKNVLVLDKPAVAFKGQSLQFYKGMQPKWRGDVIILTPSADDVTVIHETLHAQYSASEMFAYPGGRLLAIKYRMSNVFKKALRPRRKVKYKECYGCDLCRDMASQLKIYMPIGANPKHYKLVKNG